MTIDATIQRLTGDGEIIAQFLVDTLQGYTHDATVSHRLKSAEWLTAFGRLIPESAIPKSATIRPRPKSEPKPAKTDKPGKKPKVTEKQILHFDIARLIKQETNDGETIIEFLIRVISKIEETGENFTPAVRMRAARELLVRGFGGTIPGVRRILSGKTEDLDSYLSKIVREYTNYGADSIRFLVETMENKDPEADSRGAASFIKLMRMRPRTKPAEGFTASHRVWAACELLRRAYDIKTDHITYEDIQAYWSARTPADARKDDPGSPAASLKGFTPEYLETQAAKMRDAAEQPAAAENIAADAAEKRNADAEKLDVATKQPADDKQRDDKNPADANTPSDTPSRAARRREQRAERKTLKRIPLFPNRRRTREDVAEMLAFKAELESRRPAAFEFQRRQSEKRKAAAAQNIAAAKKPDAGEQPAAAAKNIAVSEKSADEQRDNAKQPAATKQPDADAEKPAAAKQPTAVDKNPANANTPSATTDRAARRRQKRDARKAEKRAVSEQPAAAANIAATEKRDVDKMPADNITENPADANTPSATTSRAARRRQKRAARKAQKRKAAAANTNAKTHAANRKNGKAQDNHATNGKTPEGAAAIILDSEPLSIEEWKRLRKTLAHPDNIPANARSP